MLPPDSDILRKLRLIEGLKADLASDLAQIYQAMAQNSPQEEVYESLAELIICSYVLGRRLGVDYVQMDETITQMLGQSTREEPEVERWFGDLSRLKRHLNQKNQKKL